MTERVYPSAKPNINPPPQTLNGTTNNTATTNPSFPATKAQLYGASRPQYRPQPKPRRSRRGCCCCVFLWLILLIIALVLLLAIAGAVFWVLYHPQRPSFSIQTLRITQFNITTPKGSTSPTLNSKLDLSVTTRNPNKKLLFIYNPITVSMFSNGVDVGDGSFVGFVHGTKNTTSLKALVSSTGKDLDSDAVKSLNTDLKKKNALPLVIKLETKVKVKFGSFKTEKVRIKVVCQGIEVSVPKGKSSPSVMKSTAGGDSKCKVKLQFKIWRWTF
ncbi:hypothetical protein IFM89_015692 [Coptis chinensis]|uniref:Late embryogenesis abundant protein LEA-2 subgroup domain-containing protein n=1 Tax=Coptis chinensis TaxID=261450 RepID=A0A835M519_9MAGN|nr:hypothetical protein IFM89_015692 [Coptis chinensis]